MTLAPPSVVIAGAGPVGGALALFLHALGWPAASLTLADRRPAPRPDAPPRLIALSHGSRVLLERIGAWHERAATPIERIHVSHRGAFGRTLIDRDDYSLPALGYVLDYGALVDAVGRALDRVGLGELHAARVVEVTNEAAALSLTLDDGTSRSADYLVHAEGGLFGEQGKRDIHRDYEQTALTAVVRTQLPSPHQAWERFTRGGPVALLPTRADGAPALGLVWCSEPDAAERRMQLDAPHFLQELHGAFGDRLGRFVAVTGRATTPLGLNVTASPSRGREFFVGNAAQTLHPVAGQGLNLGLRDAFTLAQVLHERGHAPQECGPAFAAARRLDRSATVTLTDFLPRVFASSLPPVLLARGAALFALDLIPSARHALALQMINGRR